MMHLHSLWFRSFTALFRSPLRCQSQCSRPSERKGGKYIKHRPPVKEQHHNPIPAAEKRTLIQSCSIYFDWSFFNRKLLHLAVFIFLAGTIKILRLRASPPTRSYSISILISLLTSLNIYFDLHADAHHLIIKSIYESARDTWKFLRFPVYSTSSDEAIVAASTYIIDNQKLKISCFDLHFIRRGTANRKRAVEWMGMGGQNESKFKHNFCCQTTQRRCFRMVSGCRGKTFSIALLDDDENVRNEIELFLLLNQFARHLIQKYSFPCFSFSTRFSRSQRQPVSCRTMRVYK